MGNGQHADWMCMCFYSCILRTRLILYTYTQDTPQTVCASLSYLERTVSAVCVSRLLTPELENFKIWDSLCLFFAECCKYPE